MTTLNINKNTIKNIFILEDDETRIEWFKKQLSNDFNLTITSDAVEAVNLLNQHNFDILFLDHDLKKERQDVNDKNTGSYVAKEIKKLNLKVPIIIHSWNPIGAKNMIDVLAPIKCIYIPFLHFSIKITNE